MNFDGIEFYAIIVFCVDYQIKSIKTFCKHNYN